MLVNKDLTKESLSISITKNQMYIRIFVKIHGKWVVNEYFKDYNFEIDEELISSTINYIVRTWGLKAPKVVFE